MRAAGARIKFITDGDVAGAIMAAREGTGVDLLAGIGGTPEGIIAACAISCMGGMIQGRLWPRDEAERRKALDAGHDLTGVLTTSDLVTGENIFFCATGITDGELMQGVRYTPAGPTTNSIVMRSKSGTIREIRSEHRLEKLSSYAAVDFARGLIPPRVDPRGLRVHACPWNRLHGAALRAETMIEGHDRARANALAEARSRLARQLADDPDRTEVLTRYDRWADDLWDGLAVTYDPASVLPSLVDVITGVHLARSSRLRQRDRERILRPDWFQSPDAIGYVAYADLFARTLDGIRGRIDYLSGLGVTLPAPDAAAHAAAWR